MYNVNVNIGGPRHAADILKGAASIAAFLLGSPSRRREIYYLVERRGLPVFRLGAMICARRSTLMDWMARQEIMSATQSVVQ